MRIRRSWSGCAYGCAVVGGVGSNNGGHDGSGNDGETHLDGLGLLGGGGGFWFVRC